MRNHPTVVDQANQFFDQQIQPALASIYGDVDQVNHDLAHAKLFMLHLIDRKNTLINELADVVVAIALAEIEIRDARKALEGK